MKEKVTFEKSLKRLEEIVGKLEEGNAPLEESLKLFEEGVKISRLCTAKLEEAKKKVEILVKKDGEIKVESFEESE